MTQHEANAQNNRVHQEACELLPWYVNGRLEGQEREDVVRQSSGIAMTSPPLSKRLGRPSGLRLPVIFLSCWHALMRLRYKTPKVVAGGNNCGPSAPGTSRHCRLRQG